MIEAPDKRRLRKYQRSATSTENRVKNKKKLELNQHEFPVKKSAYSIWHLSNLKPGPGSGLEPVKSVDGASKIVICGGLLKLRWLSRAQVQSSYFFLKVIQVEYIQRVPAQVTNKNNDNAAACLYFVD
jgi:hypothetical protein